MANFFGSGTGDPTRALRRIAWQSADGVPADTADMVDFYQNGGPISLGIENIERAALSGGGSVRGNPLPSKVNVDGVGPLYMGDLDAGNKAQAMLLLNFFRGYKDTITGAHHRIEMSDWLRANGGGTQVIDKLTLIGDDDKGYASRFVDVIAGGWSLNLASRDNLKLEVPIRASKVDFHGDCAVTGTGVWVPILRHFWSGNLDDTTADYDLYITIGAQGLTSCPITVRVGAAGTESSSQTITYNRWTRLYYSSDDLKLGTRRNWIEVYLPQPTTSYLKTGGTVTESDADTISVAASTWNHLGVAKTNAAPITADINETASNGVLGVGEEYKAVVSLGTSQSTPTVTKGAKAGTGLSVAPSTPANEVYLATVTITEADGIAAISQTAMVIGGYPSGDIWKAEQRRAAWTPTFGTERVVPEVNCRLLVDGVEIPFDNGVTITATAEVAETRYTPGGAQPVGTYRSGFNTVEIAVSRRYVDKNLETKLLNSTNIAFVLEAYTDLEIGSTGQDYGCAVVCPSCLIDGSTFSANENAANKDEPLVFKARLPDPSLNYAWDGETVEADCAFFFDTDFAVA